MKNVNIEKNKMRDTLFISYPRCIQYPKLINHQIIPNTKICIWCLKSDLIFFLGAATWIWTIHQQFDQRHEH